MIRVTVPAIPGSFFCHNICHNKNLKIFQTSSLITRLKILVTPSLTNRKFFRLFVTHRVEKFFMMSMVLTPLRLTP
ncbi:MAG: hypothetical protein IJU31_00605, partial [Synergistaceae bacterium]|nr:hypothetical protein [Synergistaceae bacterium]